MEEDAGEQIAKWTRWSKPGFSSSPCKVYWRALPQALHSNTTIYYRNKKAQGLQILIINYTPGFPAPSPYLRISCLWAPTRCMINLPAGFPFILLSMQCSFSREENNAGNLPCASHPRKLWTITTYVLQKDLKYLNLFGSLPTLNRCREFIGTQTFPVKAVWLPWQIIKKIISASWNRLCKLVDIEFKGIEIWGGDSMLCSKFIILPLNFWWRLFKNHQ